MNLDNLYKNIGKEYTENLLGCVMPIYLLYPEIPKYEYKDDTEYFLPLVKKHFSEITKNDLKEGDLIILNTKKCNHFCIFAGKNKFFHCTEASKLQISKLDRYLNYVKYYFKYKGETK
jgi:hypothetical protein